MNHYKVGIKEFSTRDDLFCFYAMYLTFTRGQQISKSFTEKNSTEISIDTWTWWSPSCDSD